ncbi:Aspartate kinase FUB3 [Fusarium oxysporum f. sp. albedinis]|nr:Aspartate kinase FUB3 [Fusarium oxysporum f. sp. albedinis]
MGNIQGNWGFRFSLALLLMTLTHSPQCILSGKVALIGCSSDSSIKCRVTFMRLMKLDFKHKASCKMSRVQTS